MFKKKLQKIIFCGFSVLFVGIFFSVFLATAVAVAYNPKAKIKNDGAIVYKAADFDSAVLSYLKAGELYEVSTNVYGGAFYRIKLKNGSVGYIADTDIMKLKSEGIDDFSQFEKKPEKKIDKKSSTMKEPSTKKRSFQYTKYIGLEYDNVQYRENTMGLRPTEPLGFFGIKLFGPDLAISGAVITQMNFKYYGGAPQFYEQATQRPAEGSIIMGDFQFVDVFPSGPLILAHFGFGPMFRYSSYTLQLKDAATSKVTSYGSDSIGVGAIFTLGIGVKAGPVAIRGEVQYIWEELQYFGYSLALQMPFGK